MENNFKDDAKENNQDEFTKVDFKDAFHIFYKKSYQYF